jgi:hypothetical protein
MDSLNKRKTLEEILLGAASPYLPGPTSQSSELPDYLKSAIEAPKAEVMPAQEKQAMPTAPRAPSGIDAIAKNYMTTYSDKLSGLSAQRDADRAQANELMAQAKRSEPMSDSDALSTALLTLLPTALGGIIGGKAGAGLGGSVGASAGNQVLSDFQKADAERKKLLLGQAEKLSDKAEGLDKAALLGELGLPEKVAQFGLEGLKMSESSKDRAAAKEDKADAKSIADIEKFKATERARVPSLQVVKDYTAAKSSVGRLENIVNNASAFGDISAIFAFFKSIDPTSVVRESEFATGAEAGSTLDRIQNKWSRFSSGERLQPEQRQEIMRLLKHTNKVLLENYLDSVGPTIKAAEKKGADLQEVLPFYEDLQAAREQREAAKESGKNVKPESSKSAAPHGETIIQNGVEYKWNAETGEYE